MKLFRKFFTATECPPKKEVKDVVTFQMAEKWCFWQNLKDLGEGRQRFWPPFPGVSKGFRQF